MLPSELMRSTVGFALLTGASASLPIMISAKQAGHYAFPSFAFYALALALWSLPAVVSHATGRSPAHHKLRWLAAGTIAILIGASCIFAGRPHRDLEIYHDTLAVQQRVPRYSSVGIGSDLASDYSLMAYLSRWDDIRAETGSENYAYRLASKSAAVPEGYTAVDAGLQRYQLFVRSTNSDGLHHDNPAITNRPATGASSR